MNNTLFNLLIKKKYNELIKIIKENPGIDLNIRDQSNNYLLYYTILSNNEKMTKTLIDLGAKIDITDENKRSLLYLPIKYNFTKIIDLLLEYNKNAIGLDILDIKDNNHNTVIYYAIIFNNIYIIKKIIKNINVNIFNLKGLSPLHYGIFINNIDIVNELLKNNANIDIQNNITGETPLHLAIKLKHDKMIKLLVEKHANVNVPEYEYKFTPLHYCINYYIEKISLLLEFDANINQQDIFGNTVLYYAIEHNYVDIFTIIDLEKINFNRINNKHQMIIHNVLEKDKFYIFENIVATIIKQSNLNFQDINGNTGLHLLFKLPEWKKYFYKLENKKINILVRNKNDEIPIINLDENDKKQVINYVIEKFIEQNKKNNRMPELNLICNNIGKNKEDDVKNVLKKINNYYCKQENVGIYDINNYDKNTSCEEIILQLINYFIKNTIINIFPKSYSINLTKQHIKFIEIEHELNICTYTGSTIDILSGLIYLLKKYDNVISPIGRNFKQNEKLNDIYKNFGYKINEDYEFINFEIIWINKIIVYSNEFELNMEIALKKAKEHGTRFIIIPLAIEINEKNHANYIIMDILKNSIERFEPNGSNSPIDFNYDEKLLDDILLAKFKNINKDITYLKPSDYIPYVGFEQLESYYKDVVIGDPGGFCTLWSLYYTDMRLLNPNNTQHEIINMILKSIKTSTITFKKKIRGYSMFCIKIRDDVLKKAKLNINDWLSNNYSKTQVNIVYNEFQKLLFG